MLDNIVVHVIVDASPKPKLFFLSYIEQKI